MSHLAAATTPTAGPSGVDDDAGPVIAPSTWRATLRANRAPLLIGVAVVLVALLLAAAQGRGSAGAFDPDAVDPSGSHALAALLGSEGVTVVRVTDARAAAAAVDDAHGDVTLLVVPTAPVSTEMVAAVAATSRTRTVLLRPDITTLEGLAPWAQETEPLGVAPDELAADCAWSVAQQVGSLPSDGAAYSTTGTDAHVCWQGLVVDDAGAGDTATTVIGASRAFTNDVLADSGYAALGLTTLGHSRTLVWWLPSFADPLQFGTGEEKPSISELVPSWVGWFLAQLAIAVAVIVWWRGRRLGRVVVEPLPVVVRATETVEGRARLYRRGRSRGRAADALRASTTDRLRRLVTLPRGAALGDVVAATAARTGRSVDDVAALLAPGTEPHDDASLTGLADALDTLENEVRRP